jgi:hypothetical protein
MRLHHLAGLIFVPALLQAQNASPASYAPAKLLPAGNQLVAVFIGATHVGASRGSELAAAIREMKPILARHASAAGRPLSLVGVALDWDTDHGIAFLRELGRWDEVIAGNNWLNLGAEQHIWRAEGGRPAIPQLIIYEREISGELKGLEFGPNRLLRRIVGTDSITAWVRGGAAIP